LGLVLGFGGAIVGTLIALHLARSLEPGISLGAWAGLFLANWIGNGGLLVPIPGLRLVGWTMIVHQGAGDATILVGLVGGLAMGLGQISFYLSAAAASGHHSESEKPSHLGRVAVALRRAQARTAQFVELHGISTIFTLSLFPNPLTTFASITAGATGMGFSRFLPADFAGHVILGLILALFGRWMLGG
jgi:membrane protein DedA with SNARE-associated domain